MLVYRRRRARRLRPEDLRALADEGWLAGEKLVRRHSQGVDIHRRPDFSAEELLGRRIHRRAHDEAHLRSRRLRIGCQELGDAEIEHLEDRPPALARHHEQVLRLEIAMHDPTRVRRRHRLRRLPDQLRHLGEGQGAAAAQQLLEVLALEVLHHRERAPVGQVAEVEVARHVHAADLARRPRLLHETVDDPRHRGHLGPQHLDRHLGADHRVLAEVDRADAAGPDRRADHVAADPLPDEVHRHGSWRSFGGEERRQRVLDLERARRPRRWIARQTTHDERFERMRKRERGIERGRVVGELLGDERHRRRRAIGQPSGQHLERDDAERVQIDARVLHHVAANLLRRHVRRRADDRPGDGDAILSTDEARQAEVAQLDHVAAPRRMHQDHVARAEIAMHDPFGVGGDERAAELDEDAHHARPGHRRALADRLGERRANEPLHDEVAQVERGVLAEVEDGDDILVMQLAGDARRAQKTLRLVDVGGELGTQHLERDELTENLVTRAEHQRGAAGAEPLLDEIAARDGERPGGGQRAIARAELLAHRRQMTLGAFAERLGRPLWRLDPRPGPELGMHVLRHPPACFKQSLCRRLFAKMR